MSVVVTQVPQEVVTKWKRHVTITCDGCGVQWDEPQHAYSNPSGWVIVKALERAPWYDDDAPHPEVKHFHTLACLQRWAASVTHLWESALDTGE